MKRRQCEKDPDSCIHKMRNNIESQNDSMILVSHLFILYSCGRLRALKWKLKPLRAAPFKGLLYLLRQERLYIALGILLDSTLSQDLSGYEVQLGHQRSFQYNERVHWEP